MSTPLLQHDVKTGQTKRQKAILVSALVLPVLLGAVALPAFIGGSDEDDTPRPPPQANVAPVTAADLAAAEDVEVVDPNAIVTSVDGDLAVRLSLRDTSVHPGEPVIADVTYVNHTLDDFHLPAAGEPNATLAIVVLDGEGMEVRRVVESGKDPLPGRTLLLRSGTEASIPMWIVARGEDPLPEGTYSAHVELGADEHWQRLGVRVWKAPNGVVKSFPVTFTVAQ